MDHQLSPLDQGAMHGVKVVDFGIYLAGPLVARMLCDEGAEVTHVDAPGVETSPTSAVLNRGKTRVQLDLKTKPGLASALDLIRHADVVVNNFRPGVMQRLGLGPDHCKGVNPTVIYISLPGYASTDSQLKDLRAFEGLMLAGAGVYSDMGLNRVLRGVNPSYSPLALASCYSSVMAGIGVTLALYNRDRNGLGDVIEVPLTSGLMDGLVYNSLDVAELPERYKCVREREIERRTEEGLPMNLPYDAITHMLDPFYCTYFCKDGRPLYIVAPCHEIHQRRTLQALGLWDEMVAAGLPQGDTYSHSDEWKDNCVLGTYPISSPKWIQLLKGKMQEAFKQRSAREWESIFGSMKIPGVQTQTTEEWIHSEHAQASNLIRVVEDPTYGTMLQAGPSSWTERSRVPTTPAQREVAKSIGMDSVSRGSTSQGWLEGIKVVDLCNVIAGPYIGGVLSRFGADVIKVDANKPTYDALVAVFMGVPPNRGKRSLLADLKTATGKEILHRLVQWADVVLVNQVPSQLHALGVDEASLKKINPNVIMSLFSAFGGPGWGPKSDHIGYDDLVQAHTGIMARFGGGLATPEEHAHLGTIDVVSGFSGALSVCYALLKRRRTGQCDRAASSLAANGQLIQVQYMYHYEGMKHGVEPSGPEALGEHALYHWYQASCGEWLFLTVPVVKEGPAALLNIEKVLSKLGGGGGALSGKSDSELRETLKAAFLCHPVDVLLRELDAVGVLAQLRRTMAQRRVENVTEDTTFSHSKNLPTFVFKTTKEHPIGGEVTIFSPVSIRSSITEINEQTPAPQYGQHSREVLKQLGFSASQIEGFVGEGTVRDNWSEKYLPDGDPWSKQAKEYHEYITKVDEFKAPKRMASRL